MNEVTTNTFITSIKHALDNGFHDKDEVPVDHWLRPFWEEGRLSGKYAENWFKALKGKVKAECIAINKTELDVQKLQPCLQAVSDDQITIAKAIENIREWLTGQEYTLPKVVSSKDDSTVLSKHERIYNQNLDLLRHLQGIINNWNEFGPDAGIDERIHHAEVYLQNRI